MCDLVPFLVPDPKSSELEMKNFWSLNVWDPLKQRERPEQGVYIFHPVLPALHGMKGRGQTRPPEHDTFDKEVGGST